MPNLLFALAAFTYLVFLRQLLQLRIREPEFILLLLLLALCFDNLVLLIGDGLGRALRDNASWLRYAVHVTILPLLMQAARMLAVRAGVVWAGTPQLNLITWIVVVAAMAYGIRTELVGLAFVEAEMLGHIRLVSADAHPPLATILTNVVVLGFAVAIWRCSSWGWLFVTTLFILLVNGAFAPSDYGILFGNTAEVIFALGWLVTLYRFPAADN